MPTSVSNRPVTGCVEFAALFTNPILEEPPGAHAPLEARREYRQLEQRAREVCRACPLITDCLYRAVIEHDVAGFVAGTTERQRAAIRRQLAVTVQPEDFDTLAGVTRRHRQVDHEEVLRVRKANPQDSLDRLAQRLGCSLSTVKRHLRQERRAPTVREQRPERRPSRAEVLAAAAVVRVPAPGTPAAA